MSDLPLYAVAGANGFIGHRLVEWLTLLNAARVRPLVRSYTGLARLARFDLDNRVVDVTNQAALAAALDGCDVLFHCVVGDRDTIVKGVESAYRACVQAKVRRLVYLSSAVVHGNISDPNTKDTSDLLDVQPFEYNVSKVMAERRLRNLYQKAEVEVVTLRPCIVYGPRSKWWTAQIAEDMLNGRAYLVDGGSGVCNSVYIDNLMDALYLAATGGEPVLYQEYLITDGQRVTWWDLYNSIAEALGIGLDRVRMIDSTVLLRAAEEMEPALIAAAVPASVWRGEAVIATSRASRILQAVKKAARGANPFGRPPDAPPPPPPKPPAADLPDWETASLQCGHAVLPIDKARKELGYDPHYTFAEGARLTGEWLRFAYGLR